MPKTKKFIDKKNAVTFNLVHRSQKDPLAADETAPQRVLVPVSSKTDYKPEGSSSSIKDSAKRREEQSKYGIFFDDDYDYLQHLKDVNFTAEWELAEDSSNSRTWKAPVAKGISSETKLKLPSSVFPSNVEEDVGLLNRAAPHSGPRPDLDPDVVAALDDDFDFDDPGNELEDDFIALANAGGDVDEDGEEYEGEEEEDDEDEEWEEEDDELGDLPSDCARFSPTFGDEPGDNEDGKSRFTEYSMTSSVIRRNQQLTLLDDRFDQFVAAYDDEEMGPLDCEEIEGHINSSDPHLLKLAADFEKEKVIGLKLGNEIGKKARSEVEAGIEKYLERHDSDQSDDESDNDEDDEPKKKWDCESILSTYSNLYNHPKLIAEPPKPTKITVCPKTGIPQNVLGKPGLTKKFLQQLDEAGQRNDDMDTRSMTSTLSTLSIRPKDETPDQRKERKQMIKELRRERRMEKKANTLAFKEEKKRQERQNLNNRANVQGLRLL